jgi:hypothetical protein
MEHFLPFAIWEFKMMGWMLMVVQFLDTYA